MHLQGVGMLNFSVVNKSVTAEVKVEIELLASL